LQISYLNLLPASDDTAPEGGSQLLKIASNAKSCGFLRPLRQFQQNVKT